MYDSMMVLNSFSVNGIKALKISIYKLYSMELFQFHPDPFATQEINSLF